MDPLHNTLTLMERFRRHRRHPTTRHLPPQPLVLFEPVYREETHPDRDGATRFYLRSVRVIMPYGVTYTTDADYCADLDLNKTGENEFEALIKMVMSGRSCHAIIDGSTRLTLLWVSHYPGDVIGADDALAVPVRPFNCTAKVAEARLDRYEDTFRGDPEGLPVVIV